MGFVALALSHVQPHDLSTAGLSAVTLEMITYGSEWSVQAHLNCNTSFLGKQKGFLQPAVPKHIASSLQMQPRQLQFTQSLHCSQGSLQETTELSCTAVALGWTCKQSRAEQRRCRTLFNSTAGPLCRIATYLHLPRCLVPSKTATRTQGMGSGMESKLKQKWPQASGRAVGVPPRAGG